MQSGYSFRVFCGLRKYCSWWSVNLIVSDSFFFNDLFLLDISLDLFIYLVCVLSASVYYVIKCGSQRTFSGFGPLPPWVSNLGHQSLVVSAFTCEPFAGSGVIFMLTSADSIFKYSVVIFYLCVHPNICIPFP